MIIMSNYLMISSCDVIGEYNSGIWVFYGGCVGVGVCGEERTHELSYLACVCGWKGGVCDVSNSCIPCPASLTSSLCIPALETI